MILALGRQRQDEHLKFKASLCCTAGHCGRERWGRIMGERSIRKAEAEGPHEPRNVTGLGRKGEKEIKSSTEKDKNIV